jgi:hypothetical protein
MREEPWRFAGALLLWNKAKRFELLYAALANVQFRHAHLIGLLAGAASIRPPAPQREAGCDRRQARRSSRSASNKNPAPSLCKAGFFVFSLLFVDVRPAVVPLHNHRVEDRALGAPEDFEETLIFLPQLF